MVKKMTALGNKEVFSRNLKYYIESTGKSQKDLALVLGISLSTFNDWVNGKKYPRIDKIEMLAKYFGILKSDLIEDKGEDHRQMQKKNDIITDIILKMRTDNDYLSICNMLQRLDANQLASVKQMLTAFVK